MPLPAHKHRILLNDEETTFLSRSPSATPPPTTSDSSNFSNPGFRALFDTNTKAPPAALIGDARIWLKTGARSLAKKCRIVDDTDDGKTNFVQSIFNLVNANLGTGILAMPFVIRLGGYWGILITVILGILGNYTGKNLISMLYETTEDGQRIRVRDSYADIGEEFEPRFGRLMVHVANCMEQFAHCVLLLIMPGTVVAHAFPQSGLNESTWIFILSLTVVPTILIRKMHQVTWTSVVSVAIATMISLYVLMYSLYHLKRWDSELMPDFDLKVTPISVGVVMVTFSSQAYLPSIERCMREPEVFDPLMDFTYILVTVFKFMIGILVFLAFAEDTEQIMTLNLPHSFLGSLFNVFAILLSLSFYTVPMFAVFDILENQITLPKPLHKALDTETKFFGKDYLTPNLVFRLLIVISFIVIASAVPHFSLLMSFVGNTTGTILVLVYPCIFYIKIRWDSLTNTEVVVNSLIVVGALMSSVFGILCDVHAFYSVFNKPS